MRVKVDTQNNGVHNEQCDTRTEYNMFVDDGLFCKIHVLLSQVMATSIEALFIVFGDDKYLARAISLGVDNHFQTECSLH